MGNPQGAVSRPPKQGFTKRCGAGRIALSQIDLPGSAGHGAALWAASVILGLRFLRIRRLGRDRRGVGKPAHFHRFQANFRSFAPEYAR